METYGNCNVPIRRHGSLIGIWVSSQRNNYRSLKEGKSSPVTDDHIQRLESIGFQWSIRSGQSKGKNQHDLWHKRLQELKDHMEIHNKIGRLAFELVINAKIIGC